MDAAIDLATDSIVEHVKSSGRPIPSMVDDLWSTFNLTTLELNALAKRAVSALVREKLTSGSHQSKAEVLPPSRSITVTSSNIEVIHVQVKFLTDEVFYKASDGTRKSIMNCQADDFDYLLASIDSRVDGLKRHRTVIDSTKKTLIKFGVATMGDLKEEQKLAVDQLWKSLKQIDAPALEASVA